MIEYSTLVDLFMLSSVFIIGVLFGTLFTLKYMKQRKNEGEIKMVTEEETIQHIMERYNFNRKQAKTELQDQKAIDNLKSYFDEKFL